MKVSILGIGTELTDGQIVNRNASWISHQLKQSGVSTRLHLVVPDERELMHQGIEFCALESDIIFVTGGLGPTSDDFTRDVIAEWVQEPLEFHSPSWEHLTARLTTRGYAVKEIQRQQCYFPRGAKVLFNSEGTANAFTVHAKGKTLFVLPGPPREIEAIWKSDIATWVAQATKHLDPVITRSWDTLGKGESDIATLAEEALAGAQVEKGYRVHLPYVEVKLTFKKSDSTEMQKWVDRLDQALAPHTVLRDGTDVALELTKKLNQIESLKVTDLATGTYLWQRLTVPLRPFMEKKKWNFGSEVSPQSAHMELLLEPHGDFAAIVTLTYEGRSLKETITSPYTTSNMQERSKQYIAEKALLFWYQSLG